MPPGAAVTTTPSKGDVVVVGAGLGVGVGVLVGGGVGVLVGVGLGASGVGRTTENVAELRATVRPDASRSQPMTLCEPSVSADKSSGFAVPSGAVPARSYGALSSVSVRARSVPGSRTKVTASTGTDGVTKTYA
jgi:hypothetical protein